VARSSEPTRSALITAAERLLAAEGIDRVSLREISRASGARNAVALQYHFGDRAGIVRAVLDKHYPAVDHMRHQMLDAYEAAQSHDLRDLATALVLPSAAKLSDADGGPEYLRMTAELLNRPRPSVSAQVDPADSIHRWRRMVEPFLEKDATRLHRRFTVIRFSAMELGRRAAGAPHRDDRLFSATLVDLVTGLLAAPVSQETRQLAEGRGSWASRATLVPD
jgi:AcrR family transcriptional regulator